MCYYLFRTYTWVVPLKGKKGITFQEVLDES